MCMVDLYTGNNFASHIGHTLAIPNKDLSIDAVQQYGDILRQHYKYQPIVATDWPPRVGEDFFGRLVLVEKQGFNEVSEQKRRAWYQLRGQVDKIVKMSRKKLITVNNILQPTKSPLSLRVVIDGPPGIGKTTLCRKLLNMWSNGILQHQEYELVLYCPFRNSKITTATTLADLFIPETSKLSEVVKQMSDKDGRGLLLIFDGWDELSEQLRKSSLAASIIRREKLVYCSVIVTSRSYASSSLLKIDNVSRHVQVIGFSEEEISTVIIQTLQKNSRLAQKLMKSYVGSSNTGRNEAGDDSDDSNSKSDTDSDHDDIFDYGSRGNNESIYYDSESSHCDSNSSSSIDIDDSDSNDEFEFELEILANKDSQLALKLIKDLNVRNDVQSLCYIPLVCSMVILVYRMKGHLPTTLTELYENFILQTIRRHATARCDVDDPCTLGSLSSLSAQFAKPLQEMCQIAYTNLAKTKMTFSSHQLHEPSLSEAMNVNYLGLMTRLTEYGEENYQFLHLTIQEFLAAWWIAKHEKTEEVFKNHFDDDHFRMCLRFVAGLTHLEHESYQQYFNKQQLELHCKDILFGYVTCHNGFCQNLKISFDEPHQTTDNFDYVAILLFQLLYESQNTKLFQVLAKSIKNQSLCLRQSLSLFDWLCLSYFLKNSNIIWNHLHLQGIDNESLSVFSDGLFSNNSLETQCKRLQASLIKPTDESICKLLQLPLLNNIQECYCELYDGQFVPCLILLQFLNLPQLKILQLYFLRTIQIDGSACYTESFTELQKCIEMKSTLQEMRINYRCNDALITSTISSIIRGVTKNETITSFLLEIDKNLGLFFHGDQIPDGVIKQLLKDNKKLEALSLDIPDSFIPSSLNIVEVNTPLKALKISSSKLMTSLLPHIKGLHYLILDEPYPPHLLFLSHPSLHTLNLRLDTAKIATELFTILQTNTTLKALGIVWRMDEEEKVKCNSSVGTSLTKMLVKKQNLRHFDVDGLGFYPSSFLSSLIAGIQHNSSLQGLGISLELPNNEQIRHLLNVISQKNNLIELEMVISLHHPLYDNYTLEDQKMIMTSSFFEQLVPAVTNMLQSHATIKLVSMFLMDYFGESSQSNWKELVQKLFETIFSHPSLEYFAISENCHIILMDTFKNQRKTLIDKHKKEQPHKPLPIIRIDNILQ